MAWGLLGPENKPDRKGFGDIDSGELVCEGG